eukprot:5821224-Amphidinium_carterae.1
MASDAQETTPLLAPPISGRNTEGDKEVPTALSSRVPPDFIKKQNEKIKITDEQNQFATLKP